jgi:hypothetical protein
MIFFIAVFLQHSINESRAAFAPVLPHAVLRTNAAGPGDVAPRSLMAIVLVDRREPGKTKGWQRRRARAYWRICPTPSD